MRVRLFAVKSGGNLRSRCRSSGRNLRIGSCTHGGGCAERTRAGHSIFRYCAKISNESICPGLTAICILHRRGRLGAPLAARSALPKRSMFTQTTYLCGVHVRKWRFARLDSPRAVAERLLGWDGGGARPRAALLLAS